MHRLILKKKEIKNLIIIIPYGPVGFLYAPLITFIPIKIDIVMRGEIVIVPGQCRVLFHGTRHQAVKKREG